MWGAVLGLALLNGLNPLRLGVTLLLISRPRPLPNLLCYSAGCLLEAVPILMIPLALLHFTSFSPLSQQESGVSPGMRTFQLVVGALALAVAALMVIRVPERRAATGGRHRMPPNRGRGGTGLLDKDPPLGVPFVGGPQTDGGSLFRRLLNRVRSAWDNGSLWVATVIGFITGGIPFDGVVVLLTLLVASGASVGAQFAAAIAFVVVMLVVVEVILVSYLVTPERTLAVLRRVHDWAWTHRKKLIALMFAISGLSLLAAAAGLM